MESKESLGFRAPPPPQVIQGLHVGQHSAHDRSGSLRLVYPTPNWEDFVCLVTEIRQFGGTRVQAARLLRAMLEDLTEVLPPERTELVRGELMLLRPPAGRSFPEPEDRARAAVCDLQGVSGEHPAAKTFAAELSSGNMSVPKTRLTDTLNL